MSRNDLRTNEKRWRRKHLFREQRPNLMHRLVNILFILATLAILAWWLKTLLFDLPN